MQLFIRYDAQWHIYICKLKTVVSKGSCKSSLNKVNQQWGYEKGL